VERDEEHPVVGEGVGVKLVPASDADTPYDRSIPGEFPSSYFRVKRNPEHYDAVVRYISQQFGTEVGAWLARRVCRDILRVTGHTFGTAGYVVVEGEIPPVIFGQWGKERSRTVTYFRTGRVFSYTVVGDPD
jgi:hypothetical protein